MTPYRKALLLLIALNTIGAIMLVVHVLATNVYWLLVPAFIFGTTIGFLHREFELAKWEKR